MCDTNGVCKDLCSEDDSEADSVASFATAANWESKTIRTLPMLPHELLSLEEKLKRIILIYQTDRSYHMALKDIRDQNIISLLVEPSFYGRHCRSSVIVIATSNNTYVFDLQSLGSIFPELSMLLESECPRKIMHYSHRICDLLFHHHKLKVNGICDTFVALCVARQDKTPIALQDAISTIFNIPLSKLTCDELHGVIESQRTFSSRPLSKGQLHYLATIAILQRKLHDTLMYENICSDLKGLSGKCENKDSTVAPNTD